jgi:signal transduction histidine kinase
MANAVRYTTHGSITVSVQRVGDYAEVRVTDTGSGIPEADLPHIFERFYRADASRSSQTGGTGLGLAIAKTIVEDHGGKVFAENAAGAGASVGFTLPLLGFADASGSWAG